MTPPLLQQRLRWALGVLLAWILTLSNALAQQSETEVQQLKSAMVSISIDGAQSRYPVKLPYHWDNLHSGKEGWADFVVDVDLPNTPKVPWGIFIPRVGNAYELWLNGALMHRAGDSRVFGGNDFAKVPRYVSLPLGLQAGHNELLVRIRADVGRKAGLAALTLGPAELVYPLYYRAYRTRGTGSLVVLIISLVVAIAALTLWWTQTHWDEAGVAHRDSMYLMAAIGELAWSVRVGDAIVENPPLTWIWWSAFIVAAGALWGVGMAMFCAYAAGWRLRDNLRWVYFAVLVFIVAGMASSILAIGGGYAFALTAWYTATFMLFTTFLVGYSYMAVREGSIHHQIMACVLAINVCVGVYDLVMLRISDTYGANSLQRFSSILFGVALGSIVFQRFRTASTEARELTRTLTERVVKKEMELKASYEQMATLQRQQERSAERSRILRDMHDGVGMHLSVALRQVQSGSYDPPVVAGLLQEGLDHLKLSIDALNVAPGDVTALLANFRYRLEPRLRAAGIELQWLVDDIKPRAGLDDKGMRHLQFVVYEALANVLQHAHATTVVLQAHTRDDGLRLILLDNGCGMDVTRVQQRGLASMRTRVLALGGTLNLRSEQGYTLIEVLLP